MWAWRCVMEACPEPGKQGAGSGLVRRQPPAPRGLLETLKGRLGRSCACSVPRARALLQDLVPATRWLRHYRPREDLAGDVMSGLVIGVILVPQAIAYALLAGLQPIYSLYTSFYANLIYFLLGTSRHVSVGIFSLLCLMVGQVVDRELQLAGFDPSQDGLGPGVNSSVLNSSASVLGQDCGRDCHAIRVATALTLVAGVYQVRSWLGRGSRGGRLFSTPHPRGRCRRRRGQRWPWGRLGLGKPWLGHSPPAPLPRPSRTCRRLHTCTAGLGAAQGKGLK